MKFRKMYAGFVGDKQVTKWYLSIDKAWKCARIAKAHTVKKQTFIEPA